MISKYVQLKAKNITPTLELFTKPGPGVGGVEQEWFRLTWTVYDGDTGAIDRQVTIEDSVDNFISEAKRIRTRWLAAKQIYEALKAETFPT